MNGMEMNEDELNKYLAKEQNILDHLTSKIYGPGAKFDRLSPFGQYTIESLARERALVSDPDPDLRHAKVEAMTLRMEIAELNEKLSVALRENQDLWEQNEELLLELYDLEEDSHLRKQRIREERAT